MIASDCIAGGSSLDVGKVGKRTKRDPDLNNRGSLRSVQPKGPPSDSVQPVNVLNGIQDARAVHAFDMRNAALRYRPHARQMLTTTVNDIEHIESQTMNGISVVKVFFQPNAQLPAALAQVTAISQTVLKSMPPGVTPPISLQS